MTEQKNSIENVERRTFFKKFGVVAISAGIISVTPLKYIFVKKETVESKNSVTVTINPMAVKRSNKG